MALPSKLEDQLIYWCDCQAATLSGLTGKKSSAKSECQRQYNIAVGMLGTVRATLGNAATYKQLDDLYRVARRIGDAVAGGYDKGIKERTDT